MFCFHIRVMVIGSGRGYLNSSPDEIFRFLPSISDSDATGQVWRISRVTVAGLFYDIAVFQTPLLQPRLFQDTPPRPDCQIFAPPARYDNDSEFLRVMINAAAPRSRDLKPPVPVHQPHSAPGLLAGNPYPSRGITSWLNSSIDRITLSRLIPPKSKLQPK